MTRLPLLIGVCVLPLIPVACGDSEEDGGTGASSGTSGNGGRQSGGSDSGGSSQGGGAGRAGAGGTSSGGATSGGTSSAGEGGAPDGSGGAGEGGTPDDSGGAGDGGTPGTGGSAGSGGNAGSGGSAGGGGSGGGSAGAGNGGMAGSAGGGGSGGGSAGAGSGGMAGSAGTAGTTGVCDATTPRHLSGTIGGNAFSLALNGGSSFFRRQPLPEMWDIRSRLGSDGLIHLFGPGFLEVGDQGSGTAHWMMPGEGPSAGTHFCADVSIDYVTTFRRSAALTNFTTLGACPAVPGDGSLSGCFGLVAPNPLPFACNDDQTRLVGDIEGDDIDASYVSNTDNVAAAGVAARFLAFGDRGVIALYGTPEASSGFIQFPFDGVNPGLIYCVGSATITPDGTDYTFALSGIGLLGSCPAPQTVSGQASGCL